MYGGAAKRYMQVSVQTASPGQILLALYDAAIRDARRAAEAIRAKDIQAKAKDIQHVSTILTELTSTLDFQVAPELCRNLENLYFYMQERLSYANAMLEPDACEEVARLLDTLRQAWVQAVEQVESRVMPKAVSAGR